jgi:hypothetical protein
MAAHNASRAVSHSARKSGKPGDLSNGGDWGYWRHAGVGVVVQSQPINRKVLSQPFSQAETSG